MAGDEDERRSRRLLFAPELESGRVRAPELARAEVRAALATRRVPSLPSRALQRVLMHRGSLTYEGTTVESLMAARRAVLGDDAAGPPRLLIRVDEFPHYRAWDEPRRYGTDAFRRFHSILTEAGVPYLLAVPARVSHEPLDPRGRESRPIDDHEASELADLRRDGVEFALHGLDHRTRRRSARARTELGRRSLTELDERLGQAEEQLARVAVRPEVLVPPFNRFDWRQWPVLAKRYSVVAGGPESVGRFGWHDTPLWRGDAVWMPAYPPLYGRAEDAAGAVGRLAGRGAALWVPVVLHWGWEADSGWEGLERFARAAAPYAAPWRSFLDPVAASRGDAAASS